MYEKVWVPTDKNIFAKDTELYIYGEKISHREMEVKMIIDQAMQRYSDKKRIEVAGNFATVWTYGPKMLAFTIVYKVTGNFELARNLWGSFYNEFLHPICTDTEANLELYYIDVQGWIIEYMDKTQGMQ